MFDHAHSVAAPLSRISVARVAAAVLAASVLLLGAGCGRDMAPEAVLARAQSALEKRDSRSSEIELRTLLQAQPDHARARLLLGRIHLANIDYKSAEKELRRAGELGISADEVGPGIVESIFQTGEYQKAIDAAGTLTLTAPAAKADVINTVGRALLAQQKYPQAKAKFDEALQLDPAHLPSLVSVIGWQAMTGDRAGAAAQLQPLLERHPSSIELLTMAGDLDLADGKLDSSRARFAKVVEMTPTNLTARAKLTAILIDQKDYPAAEKQLGELRRVAGNSPGTSNLLALYEFRRGRLDAALLAVQSALKSAPDYLPALALGASVSMQLNQLDSAERYARQVIDKAPDSHHGHKLLAAIYLRMNSPDRALAVLQPLIDKGTDDAAILSLAGEASLKQNDANTAAVLFERAARLDPKDATKRTGLALSRFVTGERDKAFADLEAAAELDTNASQADFALIMARVRENQLDKALEAVAKFESKQPNSPVPTNLRGMVLIAKEDQAGARAAFDKALQIDPTFFPAAANLATLDYREKKPEAAKARYEKLLQSDPKNMSTLIALARHMSNHGASPDQALHYLQEAQKQNPGALPPILALASFHLERDQPTQAITLLENSLAANPERTELMDLLATAHLRANEPQRAVEIFERLVRNNPRMPGLHMRLGELRANLGDTAGAAANFKRAAELAPKAAEPRIAQATVLLRQGKKTEARAVAQALKKELPNSSAGQQLEADLLVADERYGDAIAIYKGLFEKERTAQIASKYFLALSKAGKEPEAEAFLKQWQSISPNDITVLMYAAEQRLSAKRWQAAADLFRVALRKDARNVVASNNAAWALHQLKDPAAEQLAEQALGMAPQNPAVLDTYAVILNDRGNSRRAVDLLKQAVTLAPHNADYRLHLAQALVGAGNGDAARNELDSLLRDHPSGPTADQARKLQAGVR